MYALCMAVWLEATYRRRDISERDGLGHFLDRETWLWRLYDHEDVATFRRLVPYASVARPWHPVVL